MARDGMAQLGRKLIQPSATARVFFLSLGFPAQEDGDGTTVLALRPGRGLSRTCLTADRASLGSMIDG